MDDITPVLFRELRGEILAILPSLPASNCRYMCYAHIGQHGEIDRNYTQFTRPASKEQYADLLQELISIGYDNLKVYKRLQRL